MKSICIIPARGGSKRIKNKNLVKINNKSLLSYSINKALKLNIFERVIVSTDSNLIAKEALKHGAEVIFRSKKLSGDFVPLKNVINNIIVNNNLLKYDFIVCLLATSPLLQIKSLKKAIEKISSSKKFDMLLSVNPINKKYNRSLIKENDYIRYINQRDEFKRTQDLDDIYIDSGSFFIFRPKKYIKSSSNLLKKTTYFAIPNKEDFDIDTYDDLMKVKKVMSIKSKI